MAQYNLNVESNQNVGPNDKVWNSKLENEESNLAKI